MGQRFRVSLRGVRRLPPVVAVVSRERSSVNVISEWGSAATYNGAGRSVTLSGVATVQVLYNALSQRILKVTPAGTTVFVYDENGHLLGEYDGTGALIEETVWLGDTPVATLQPNAGGTVAIYYIHSDHLNSPRKISVPSNNQLVWRWDSDPFADQQPDGDPLGTGQWFTYNLGFPGQYFDEESGLAYNYYRYYDPLSGTYLQSDPMGLLAGINTYAYVGGNPLSLIDPLGLAAHLVLLEYGNSRTQPLYDWAQSYQPAEFNTVVVHGTPDGRFAENYPISYSIVPPESVAQLLKDLPGYDPNLPTQLVACTSGATRKAAQALANALNATVYAPEQILAAGPTPGSPPQVYVPSSFWSSLFGPAAPPPINWIPFKPNK